MTVDVAGARMGGAARFLVELHGYLKRTGREDVEIIGSRRRVRPGWLVRRELSSRTRSRRVALNNVGFITPGGPRWTLMRNALHFLTEGEQARLDPAVWATVRRDAAVVHLAARRSDVIVAPSTAMAERIATVRPELSSRVVVRPHPVSAALIPRPPGSRVILCPVLFAPHKRMTQRLTELLTAIDDMQDPVSQGVGDGASGRSARGPGLPSAGRTGRSLAPRRAAPNAGAQPRYLLPDGPGVVRLPARGGAGQRAACHRPRHPQNREIAGPALCGYTLGDRGSLPRRRGRTDSGIAPDPGRLTRTGISGGCWGWPDDAAGRAAVSGRR